MHKLYLFILFLNMCIANNKLDIINFNIHGFGKLVGGPNIEDKIKNILDEMINYDIIFIQENWKHDKLINDKLIDYQLIFSKNKKNIFSQSSGLVIAITNNIEIIDHKHILYNNCNGIILNGNDCFSSKGFIFSRIKFHNKVIDLYNTHLDAGNSSYDKNIRLKQLNQLRDFIIENSSNNNLVICGDFNIDFNTSNLMISFKNIFNLDKINWGKKYFLEEKIDYILYKMKFKYEIADKDISQDLYYLSDHPPMSLSIVIRE